MAEDALIRYKGKIAPWWHASAVLMIGCTLIFFIQSALGIASSSPGGGIFTAITLVFLLFDLFFIDSYIRNYIDFCDSFLRVRVSIFSATIPYSEISLIKETNSAWASLSTSLDRLLIRYRRFDDVLISVQDKEGFLSEMLKRNPQIRIERKSVVKGA